jgi:predicted ATPase
MLGYPEQAVKRSQEALTLARELSDPVSLAHARFHLVMFHQFRRDGAATQELAEALLILSAEQGLPTYVAGGSVLLGWALAERGQAAEGLAQIRQGLAAMATSVVFWRTYFQALLAEVYGKGGNVEEGLAVLVEALRRAADTRMGFYEPEMHRVHGELLLASSPANPADAESCFRQAIACAGRQRARSLELRAVLSLSRLYIQQGRREEVRAVLAEIYGWFTEGFDTVDLQEAKTLLDVVS